MRVKLLSKTENVFTTISNIWQASRTNDPIDKEVILTQEVKDLFFSLLQEDVPLMEMVELIFLLEDIPISLREQIVRHRLGIKFDDRLGADIVPELMDSTFWCQSMRVMDMGCFASEGNYFVPESIHSTLSLAKYDQAMKFAEIIYKQLIIVGVPREDARQVIPLGATHRMVWKLSLSALKHICSKRSCWIAQLGMWKPIIKGFVNEMTKIDKRFYNLVTPPCIQNEKFQGCKFCEHNKKRVVGEGEQMPPCPLYLHYHEAEALQQKNAKWTQTQVTKFWVTIDRTMTEENQMEQMKKEYEEFWRRNINTGERWCSLNKRLDVWGNEVRSDVKL